MQGNYKASLYNAGTTLIYNNNTNPKCNNNWTTLMQQAFLGYYTSTVPTDDSMSHQSIYRIHFVEK